MRAFASAIALVALATCAGPMERVEAQFAQGRYPDAKRALEGLEAESRSWSDAKRAEYALYRGLTYRALGDRDQAGAWLRQAAAIERAHPGALSVEDARRLAATGLDYIPGDFPLQ